MEEENWELAKKENRHAEHFDKLSASLVSASANIDAPYELPEER